MKIYLMTDLEGVAGVLNYLDWCTPDGRYYELAKELLTQEANAAIEGFFAGGATQITVADGHGHGGINPVSLDSRVELIRGWPDKWPLLLDKTYNALAFIGQHAMAGSEYAHLPHTGDFNVMSQAINDLQVGEFGRLVLCAGELAVPTIFGSGDQALCREAEALVPGIMTACVKKGTTPRKGDELDYDQYVVFNSSAIHLHPRKSREMIQQAATCAVQKALTKTPPIVSCSPPYQRVTRFRAQGPLPAATSSEAHPSSVIALLNLPYRRNATPQSESDVS